MTTSTYSETAASLAARALFWPSLAWNVTRERLDSSWHWCDQITEHVVLGAIPTPGMIDHEFKQMGVKAVVTLNEEFEIFVSPGQWAAAGMDHLHLPTVDFMFAPPLVDLHRGADFIAGHAAQGSLTYVHCKAGRGRSTVVVLCYLIKYHGFPPEAALEHVRARRHQIRLAPAQWQSVEDFWRACCYDKLATAAPTAPPSGGSSQSCVPADIPAGSLMASASKGADTASTCTSATAADGKLADCTSSSSVVLRSDCHPAGAEQAAATPALAASILHASLFDDTSSIMSSAMSATTERQPLPDRTFTGSDPCDGISMASPSQNPNICSSPPRSGCGEDHRAAAEEVATEEAAEAETEGGSLRGHAASDSGGKNGATAAMEALDMSDHNPLLVIDADAADMDGAAKPAPAEDADGAWGQRILRGSGSISSASSRRPGGSNNSLSARGHPPMFRPLRSHPLKDIETATSISPVAVGSSSCRASNTLGEVEVTDDRCSSTQTFPRCSSAVLENPYLESCPSGVLVSLPNAPAAFDSNTSPSLAASSVPMTHPSLQQQQQQQHARGPKSNERQQQQQQQLRQLVHGSAESPVERTVSAVLVHAPSLDVPPCSSGTDGAQTGFGFGPLAADDSVGLGGRLSEVDDESLGYGASLIQNTYADNRGVRSHLLPAIVHSKDELLTCTSASAGTTICSATPMYPVDSSVGEYLSSSTTRCAQDPAASGSTTGSWLRWGGSVLQQGWATYSALASKSIASSD